MANKEIGDLTAASALTGAELVYIVQGGNSRKSTTAGIAGLVSVPTPHLLQKPVVAVTAAYTAVTATIPYDDTIPQNTEGGEILTATITPVSASSMLVVTVFGQLITDVSGVGATAALFRDSTANAVAAHGGTAATGNRLGLTVAMKYSVISGSTSATTFKVRVGASSGNINVNGDSSGHKYGGVSNFTMTIEEFAA